MLRISIEQPAELILHHPVTLAGVAFQALAIEDRDSTALVADQARALKGEQNVGDARTSNPNHLTQELMGERQLVAPLRGPES